MAYPFKINCFGYGAAHDGKLLQQIAGSNHGNYFHI